MERNEILGIYSGGCMIEASSFETLTLNDTLPLIYTAVTTCMIHATTGERAPTMLSAFTKFTRFYGERLHGPLSAVICSVGILLNLFCLSRIYRLKKSVSNVILLVMSSLVIIIQSFYMVFVVQFYVIAYTGQATIFSKNVHWVRFLLIFADTTVIFNTALVLLMGYLAQVRYLFTRHKDRFYWLLQSPGSNLIILFILLFAILTNLPNLLTNAICCGFTTDLEIPSYDNETDLFDFILNITFPDIETLISTGHLPMPTASLSPKKNDYGNVSVSFLYRQECQDHERHGYMVGFSELAKPGSIMSNINFWLHGLILRILPALVLAIATIMNVKTLISASKRHNLLQQRSASMAVNTFNLGGVSRNRFRRKKNYQRSKLAQLFMTLTFLVAVLPLGVLSIACTFNTEIMARILWPLGDILDVTMLVPQAIVVPVYCWASSEFRAARIVENGLVSRTYCDSERSRLRASNVYQQLSIFRRQRQQFNYAFTQQSSPSLTSPNTFMFNRQSDIQGQGKTKSEEDLSLMEKLSFRVIKETVV